MFNLVFNILKPSVCNTMTKHRKAEGGECLCKALEILLNIDILYTTNSKISSDIPFYPSWPGQICTFEEERDRSLSRSGELYLYFKKNHWNIEHNSILTRSLEILFCNFSLKQCKCVVLGWVVVIVSLYNLYLAWWWRYNDDFKLIGVFSFQDSCDDWSISGDETESP